MIAKKRDLPGPGQYSPKNGLSKDGVYKVSGFKNTATVGFKPSERFKSIRNSLPGPGQYDPPASLNPRGKNFVSKFKNVSVGLFGTGSGKSNISSTPSKPNGVDKSKTSIFEPSTTPGPGWYDIPTELGFMEKNLIR